MKRIQEYCRLYYQKEVEKTLFLADKITEGIFIFDNPWDLESYGEPVDFSNGIIWGETPDGDPEFMFQLNRHRCFICLGQAYALTNERKYISTFENILLDWLDKVPLTKDQRTKGWRSIEAGFRGEYWTKGMSYFKNSGELKQETMERYKHSLKEHAAYLESEYSDFKRISNWGIIEAHGLFEIAVELLETEGSSHYAQVALQRLEIASELQIMHDGMHWEQSPMYHKEVFHCFMDVLTLAKKHQINVPDKLLHNVKAMADAMIAFVKPNGNCFMNGDSDDMDFKDSLAAAAWYFKDSFYRYVAGDRIGYENVWELGIEAVQEYEQMEMKKPNFLSIALEQSGNYYLRSNWNKDGNLLHFHCGTLGAGHGHSDKLHIDLVMNGRDVLTDSGRYTYAVDKGRIAFKDPQAHNTIIVDEKPFTECIDSWECSKLSQPVNRGYMFTKDYEFVQGGHLGYMDEGIFVNRKIVWIKPDIYLIVDEIYGVGEHSYESYFHFSEKGKVSINNNNVCYEDSCGKVYLHSLTKKAEVILSKSQISRHYNNMEENDCIKIQKYGDGFTSFLTVITSASVEVEPVAVKSVLKGISYTSDKAEGVKIVNKDETYWIAVCHKEVNSPTDMVEVDGNKGMGNVIVWSKSSGFYGGNVLLW